MCLILCSVWHLPDSRFWALYVILYQSRAPCELKARNLQRFCAALWQSLFFNLTSTINIGTVSSNMDYRSKRPSGQIGLELRTPRTAATPQEQADDACQREEVQDNLKTFQRRGYVIKLRRKGNAGFDKTGKAHVADAAH